MKLQKSLAIASALATLLSVSAAAAEIKINPGPIAGETIELDNARGVVWCEIMPMVGTAPALTMHIYNSTSVDDCTEARTANFDAAKLAAELKVPKVALNPGRYWVMDKVTAFTAGETVELQGIKVKWAATMTPEAVGKILGSQPYTVAQITRDTEWLYRQGKPVWLLRAPEGKVWILQVFTKAKDPTLSMDTLDTLASKLQLPAGWSFDKQILTKDLSLQPRRSSGNAYIMRDNLGNTYQGCGFDATCNYLP